MPMEAKRKNLSNKKLTRSGNNKRTGDAEKKTYNC